MRRFAVDDQQERRSRPCSWTEAALEADAVDASPATGMDEERHSAGYWRDAPCGLRR